MNKRFAQPFTRLAWANLGAQSTEQLTLAATLIVAVLALDAGPGEIGFLAAMQTLPFLLFSIPIGIAVDRMSRLALMRAAEILRSLALLALVPAVASGSLSVGLLAALGFVGAVGTVGFSVAAPSLVPSLVPPKMLGRANGRLELARSVAFAAGPALGGALVSWAGAPAAFVLATVLSVGAIVMLTRIAEPARAAVVTRHPWVELRDGARLVWHDPLLRPILLTAVVWNIAWFVLQASYVSYAVRFLALSAGGIGVTLAAYGIGMVVGALAASMVLRVVRFGLAVLVGPALSVIAAVLMVATLRWPAGQLAAFAFFLFGAGPILWTITSTTLRQTVTPALS